MSNRTYLIVFHGHWIKNRIFDIGDDPCFSNLPSWGICRPPTRRMLLEGDTLFFLAKINNDYFLKGWFQVGHKLDYFSAMKKFSKRQNVIISLSSIYRKDNWRYKELKHLYESKYGTITPHFLKIIKTQEGLFYQNPTDNHEIDNWKCRRIFHCQSKQFKKCIETNDCLMNGISLKEIKFKNYIVAHPQKWEDTDVLKITLEEIRSGINFNLPIKTPHNQHNVIRIDDYKQKLLDFIEKRKLV